MTKTKRELEARKEKAVEQEETINSLKGKVAQLELAALRQAEKVASPTNEGGRKGTKKRPNPAQRETDGSEADGEEEDEDEEDEDEDRRGGDGGGKKTALPPKRQKREGVMGTFAEVYVEEDPVGHLFQHERDMALVRNELNCIGGG